MATGQAQYKGACFVADCEGHMFEKDTVELVQCDGVICFACSQHFLQYIGVTTGRALSIDHHITGQDICTFNGNADGNGLINAAQIIIRSQHDALAAMDIHGIVDQGTHTLGQMIFDDRGDD